MVPEGWSDKPVGERLKLASGAARPEDTQSEPSARARVPVYGGNGVLGYCAQSNWPTDAIVIGRVGEKCGVTRHVSGPIWISDNALYTREIASDTDIKFLTYRLQYFDLSRLRKKGGQPLVTQKPIYALKLPFPPLPEQQKIAEILSTWDKAIETTKKLLANAEAQKRALMQQLLTGKRRLKGFEGSEWYVKSLGELGETYGGLTGKSKEDFGSGAPYITYMMVFGNSAVDMRQVDHVTVGANERQHRVQKGDIFFTTSSETPDEVGMSSVLLEEPGKCYLNSFCFGYRLHKANSLIPEFARHLLRGPTFRRDIRKLAQGATRYNLSKRELMKLEINLPQVEEQRAIVAILDNANDTVEGLKQQLALLGTEKRSLMQQLLTGKRRVTI